ncbi:meiotic recombination protein REC114 isoform X2 [Odocoileus virginianus]|uniref:Meiotic recombination protein REC114 isoform X2 n=1 Tax=Odocoileus virginianus TaxID=9874 RepID=A0ABM4IAR1_ODOVR
MLFSWVSDPPPGRRAVCWRSPGPSRSAPGEGVSGKCTASGLLLGFSCDTGGGESPAGLSPAESRGDPARRAWGKLQEAQGARLRPKPFEEGFSLIGSKNWLKIVRRMDCLLFGTTIKNKSRMFRVQFSGGSREQALEHCYSCVQNLAQYITVQVPDGISQEFRPSPDQGKRCVQSIPPQYGKVDEKPEKNSEQQQRVPADASSPGGRTSVAWLAQSLMASEELPLVYEQSAWNAQGLGPFLRLCLMDQNFPAFVEEVEKELKKLTGLSD